MRTSSIYIVLSLNVISFKAWNCKAQSSLPRGLKRWETLNELAEGICEKMTHPSGDGLDLIEDVHCYYECLEQLAKAAGNKDHEAVTYLNSLRENGGPKHLIRHPIDPVPLVKSYQWNEFATSQFAGFLEYSWNLWRDLQAYLEMRDKNQNWISQEFGDKKTDSVLY